MSKSFKNINFLVKLKNKKQAHLKESIKNLI